MTAAPRRAWTARDTTALCAALLCTLFASLCVASLTGTRFLAHSAYDSYTLQALTWRSGRISLDQDYPWLELAIYQGRFYISFPQVPALPMLLLSFFFGDQTPSGLVTLLYLLGSVCALYALGRRYLPRGQAGLLACFAALGGSLLDLAVSGHGSAGGVWYQAQLLGLLLTALAFLLLDGDRKSGWAWGLVCIALAVGCRPFNAVYVPVLLWLLLRKIKPASLASAAKTLWPYLLAPALIACAYGAYNAARFGSPFEFGHSYLPEFVESGEAMFSIARIPQNIRYLLRMPAVQSDGTLTFPIIFGFGVYLTQPLLFMGIGRGVLRLFGKRGDKADWLLCVSALMHLLLLLTHRTNGGWQYGARYLCDMLPALFFLFVRGRRPLHMAEAFLMGALILFNLYGTILFHSLT